MHRKIINSKKLGRTLEFTTRGRYLYLDGVQCRDNHGYAYTVDDNDFTRDFDKVVKKYYNELLRQHNQW